MDRPRTCLTGAERSAEQLARRLQREGDLHEVRLDLLDRVDAGAFEVVARHGPRVIATCRPVREGGGFDGDEAARLALLRKAGAAGARWLDVELEVFESGNAAAVTEGLGCEIVVSLHDFEGGVASAEVSMARLARCDAGLSKLAVTVARPDDLVVLKRLDPTGRSRVVIGMGPAGAWTRLRPADFGSAWTYVVEDARSRTAPGQFTLDRAARLRLGDHEALRPVAVVDRSFGSCVAVAEVCCDLAVELGEPLQFVPLPAGDPREIGRALGELGAPDVLDVAAIDRDPVRLSNALESLVGRPLRPDHDLARKIGWS